MSSVNSDMLDETQLEEEDNDEEAFSCFLCNFRSRAAPVLGEHVATHHPYIFKLSNSKAVLSKLTQHDVTNTKSSHMDVADHSSNEKDLIPDLSKNDVNNTRTSHMDVTVHKENNEKDSNPGLSENDVTFHNNDNDENRCTLCKLTLSSKRSLRRHSQFVHFKKGEFPCQKCKNVFNEKNQLKLHLISVHFHQVNKPVDPSDHSTNDQSLKINCKVCDMVFSSPTNLKRHEQKFHLEADGGIRTQHDQSTSKNLNQSEEIKLKPKSCSENLELFECNFCGKKFGYLFNVKRHIKRTHDTHQDSSIGGNFCHLCQKTFVDDVALQYHLRNNHLQQSELNNTKSEVDCRNLKNTNESIHSKKESDTRALTESPKENICGYCGKNFSSVRNLRRHIKGVHIPEETRSSSSRVEINICDHCGKRFLFRENLNDHLQNCLSKESKVETDDNQKLPEKGQLLSQNQDEENKEQKTENSNSSFILENVSGKIDDDDDCRQMTFDISTDNDCNLCGKKFNHRQSVVRHIKMVHFHEKKYECKECDKKYVERRDLLKHIEVFHTNKESQMTSNVPTTNELENLSSGSGSGSQKEVMSGSGYQEKVLVKSDNLIVRTANHLEEESQAVQTNSDRMRCRICDKKFTSSRNVDRHIRMVHLKQKDYSCTPCDAKFFSKRDLLSHCVRFHSEDIISNEAEEELQSFNESIEMKDIHVPEMNNDSGSQENPESLKGYLQSCSDPQASTPSEVSVYTSDQNHFLKLMKIAAKEIRQVVQAGEEIRQLNDDKDGKVCAVCHKVFADNYKRRRHFRLVHMNERKHVCQNCGRAYQDGRGLRRHLLNCNSKQESSSLNLTQETIPQAPKNSIEDRPRKREGKFFLSSTMINNNGVMPLKSFDLSPVTRKENVKMEDDEEDDVIFVEQEDTTANQEKPGIVKPDPITRSIGEKHHMCVECENTFTSRKTLKRHVDNVHLKKGAVSCHLCDKTFSNDSALQRHNSNVHLKKGVASCHLCNKTFYDDSSLQRHNKNVHLKKGVVASCLLCDKTFYDDSSLRRHNNNVHLKKGGALCHLCNKTFSDDFSLRRHNKAIHFKTI